ncbi:DoxX family protein [Dongia mobilis]|jgi:putative oxidoreductase|uniref:DoxX family protein n=1 Tax=Dongia sp. TaxID=1977262 RepID=UPI0026EFF1BA
MHLRNLVDLFARIPQDLIILLARLGIGAVFLRSGLLKLDGWDNGNTLALFQYEYQLPLIPPELAAPLAMAMELTVPLFLFAGLATRFAALALLGMTLVIQTFVYPNAFDTHAVWAVALLCLIKFGGGIFSLDHLLGRIMPQRASALRRGAA